MTASHTIRVIAATELAGRLRNKAFVLATAAMLVGAVAAVVVPSLLAGDGPADYELGVAGDVPDPAFYETLPAVASQHDARIEIVELADAEAATAAVEGGEVDAALVDGERLLASGPQPPMALHRSVQATLTQARQRGALADAGLAPAERAAVLAAGEPLAITDPGSVAEAGDDRRASPVIGLATLGVLALAITTNAGPLLSGTMEEKSSRVVEVLLGRVRPWHLLAGKLAAMSLLALGQLALLVAAALTANAVVDAVALPPTAGATITTAAVMVIVGFAFYAALYALVGSMVSSMEEAQTAMAPLSILVIGVIGLVSATVVPTPSGPAAQMLTFLPPSAPFVVPIRMALDAVPLWQAAVAVGLTVAAAIATVRLAGRLYSAALLAGDKLTWRQVWHAEPIR